MNLREMVAESNRIEGILRDPTKEEIDAHEALFRCREPDVHEMERFVSIVQPGAKLRDRKGLNVCVGAYLPPPGGPEILHSLADLLYRAGQSIVSPYNAHIEYEKLHPFTDGNGRSGRALWYWMMQEQSNPQWQLGFLHAFYYQTLAASGDK